MAAPLPTADSHAALPTFADAKCWHCRSCRSKPAVSYANPLCVSLKLSMVKDYILLKDVNRKSLSSAARDLVDSMKIEQADIYKDQSNSEFIITFPKGISNELFIFFYCALMAPDLTNSEKLFGWFFANDDMTLNSQNGDFGQFKSTKFTKRIMILPDGDDKGNIHQYGITENGKEIHFGMDGTFKIMAKTEYNYQYPILNMYSFEKIEIIERKKGFIEKLKIKLGI